MLPNENFALIVMMTRGAEARERLKARLERLIADNLPAITAILREYSVPLVDERGELKE